MRGLPPVLILLGDDLRTLDRSHMCRNNTIDLRKINAQLACAPF